MAIISKFVEIYNAKGGPNADSAPIYGDNKAPNGDWAYDPKGKQLMWPNGMRLVCVDPLALSSADGIGNFVKYEGNVVKYVRVWVFNPESGKGDEYAAGKQTWIEYDKLKEFAVEDPEPEPEPEPVSGWVEYDWKLEGGRLFLKKV